MKGVVLLNYYSPPKGCINQAERLREEFSKLGVSIDIMPNFIGRCGISSDGKGFSRFGEYDFCIYLDKDKYASELLERTGMRLFNSHRAIRVCDDKAETHIALSGAGIPMPRTLPGLLCYDRSRELSEDAIAEVESEFGYPLIVKSCFGSLGKGVWKVDGRDELRSIMRELQFSPHLFQEFIASSSGRDVRVILIGGRAVAAMKRTSMTDFRSNIELGGVGETFDLPDSFKDVAERAAAILGLDYCGIDLMFSADGTPILCEVNSNAFFAGIERVTGVNIAEKYARHIVERIKTI